MRVEIASSNSFIHFSVLRLKTEEEMWHKSKRQKVVELFGKAKKQLNFAITSDT